MVEWSIEAFREAGVGGIVVAVPPGHAYEPAVVEPHGSDPPEAPLDVRVLAGGETRSASVSNALEAVKTDLVAIHDAARPLLRAKLVEGVVATLADDPEAAGAIAAAPVADTIKHARTSAPLRVHNTQKGALVVSSTMERSRLWAAQTPQAFRVEALREAFAGDRKEIAAATDEAMLVEAAGGRVLIHPADAENLKVTTPLDLRMAEALLRERTAA